VKTELEQSDIQAIATAVVDLLRPSLSAERRGPGDEVFDKQGLADYLHVKASWIDKQLGKRAIPYFKPGKYIRFKRSHIDRWIETLKVEPLPELKRYRRG
jgi:excisionase family DNA binding protein